MPRVVYQAVDNCPPPHTAVFPHYNDRHSNLKKLFEATPIYSKIYSILFLFTLSYALATSKAIMYSYYFLVCVASTHDSTFTNAVLQLREGQNPC